MAIFDFKDQIKQFQKDYVNISYEIKQWFNDIVIEDKINKLF